jgi:hypothetical protein
VVVSATTLMCVLARAGLPHGALVYGGAESQKTFLLDEHDRLTDMPGHYS